jgi:anti-anti-sigma factor
MEITVKQQANNIAIITIQGKIDVNATANFKQEIKQVIKQGYTRLVLNLFAVPFIDSSGLTALISGLRQSRLADGDLRLACVDSKVQRIMDVTGLKKVMHLYPTVDQAIASYEH